MVDTKKGGSSVSTGSSEDAPIYLEKVIMVFVR